MKENTWAYIGGKQVKLVDAKVGIMTPALHYGTAVFEGIRGNWNNDHNKMYVFRLSICVLCEHICVFSDIY